MSYFENKSLFQDFTEFLQNGGRLFFYTKSISGTKVQVIGYRRFSIFYRKKYLKKLKVAQNVIYTGYLRISNSNK